MRHVDRIHCLVILSDWSRAETQLAGTNTHTHSRHACARTNTHFYPHMHTQEMRLPSLCSEGQAVGEEETWGRASPHCHQLSLRVRRIVDPLFAGSGTLLHLVYACACVCARTHTFPRILCVCGFNVQSCIGATRSFVYVYWAFFHVLKLNPFSPSPRVCVCAIVFSIPHCDSPLVTYSLPQYTTMNCLTEKYTTFHLHHIRICPPVFLHPPQLPNYQYEELTAFKPYEILNVDESSTDAQIKKAYRKMSLKYHPGTAKHTTTQQHKSTREHTATHSNT